MTTTNIIHHAPDSTRQRKYCCEFFNSLLGSSPGGIVASQFFGYDGGYYTTDSIRPGKGYWVKVKENGKLILSSSGGIAPTARIRILPDGEKPPAPPDGEVANPISNIPNRFALQQNYPNPFNPTTNFEFRITNCEFVSLKVFDIIGREVATLVNEVKQPGEYTVRWDASSIQGGLPSGVYVYRLSAGSFTEVRKLLLLK